MYLIFLFAIKDRKFYCKILFSCFDEIEDLGDNSGFWYMDPGASKNII